MGCPVNRRSPGSEQSHWPTGTSTAHNTNGVELLSAISEDRLRSENTVTPTPRSSHFASKQSLYACKKYFNGTGHWEPTRSAAADDYVWKDETAVEDSRFEWGHRPKRFNCKKDWDAIWQCAVIGDYEAIPASVRVSSYRTLKAIASDHMVPTAMERVLGFYVQVRIPLVRVDI